MKHATALVFLLVTLWSCVMFAQEKEDRNASIMKKPGPGPERARLSFLVGNFTTETRILRSRMMKKEAVGTGTSVIGWDLDSMFLTVNEQSINPLLGDYKGHGMLGYDSQEKQYVLSMFNNFGDRPEYRGDFVGDTLLLTTKVPVPGRSFDQRLQWYKEGNTVRLRILNNMGEGFVLVVDQTATPPSGIPKR